MNNVELDLHGLNINEATMEIMTFLFQKFNLDQENKVFIITGKGDVLQEHTIQLLEKENYHWSFDQGNEGKIIVYSKEEL